MGMTDPIADMLTRLRNANSVLHDKVEIPLKLNRLLQKFLKKKVSLKTSPSQKMTNKVLSQLT